MTTRRLERIIRVAGGKDKADLVLQNCRVVDPISQTVAEGDIAIFDGYIVGVGKYTGKREIDAEGAFATSGLIDAHVHIESSMCTPEAFAAMVIPFGTTTVIADPHEIANVKGIDGIRFMMMSADRTPLKARFMASSCVPAMSFEDSGAEIDSDAIESLLKFPYINGLGEMMNAPGILGCDIDVLEKLCACINERKNIDGHGPGLHSLDLNAYRVAGVTTDHECVSPEEVRARLKRGMFVLLRQGSAAQNLADLLPGVSEASSRRCAMCTDDKHPGDILRFGHINHNLRIACEHGMNPFSAIAMATINAAECYRLRNIGLIAPGFKADIVLFEDLKDFRVKKTFIDGVLVAEDGRPCFEVQNRVDKNVTHSVNIKPVSKGDLQISVPSGRARVMQLLKHDLITNCVIRAVETEGGFFKFGADSRLTKLAVVERHHATGKLGLCLIENYGIRDGAVATTIGHDSHNLVVAGDNDADMLAAISALEQIGGGIAIARGGKIVSALELPIGGIMSNKSAEEISVKMDEMLEIARNDFGINPDIDPFMTLSFLSLSAIPHLKITARGLFDVDKFAFTTVDAAN